MKYQSGSAFRRALEERLRSLSLQTGVPLVRLRKTVAFERFLARLFQAFPDTWMLKGGLALQLHLGSQTRTTKDVDLLTVDASENVYAGLQQVGRLDLGDYFSFTIARSSERQPQKAGGTRYAVQSLLDDRTFERFHLDVGVGDPVLENVEYKTMPDLLDFAGIPSTRVPCYPVSQQIAEKFHAYTRPRNFGENSRVKDFVDMYLLALTSSLDSSILLQALQATFAYSNTHPLPEQVPAPPEEWGRLFRRSVKDITARDVTLEEAHRVLSTLLNPILGGMSSASWLPGELRWQGDDYG
jgi:predicted nucleotidyltransferase component of viral defense system